MSFEAMMWAWDLSGISPLAKLLAIGIANGYAPYSTDCDCKWSTLEEFTGIERFELAFCLDEIEDQCPGFRFTCAGADIVRVSIPIDADHSTPATQPPKVRPPHWVYVIRARELTKIGISRDVKQRFDGLQKLTPDRLTISWAETGPVQIIRKVERASHVELAQYREFGEWFRISPEIAIATVQRQMLAHGLSLAGQP